MLAVTGVWIARSQHEPGKHEREKTTVGTDKPTNGFPFPMFPWTPPTRRKENEKHSIGHTADPDVSLFSLVLVVVY